MAAAVAALLLAALAAGAAAVAMRRQRAASIPMPDESLIELSVEHDGATYKLFRGDLYRVSRSGDRLEFVENIYDPGFHEKGYAQVDGQTFRTEGDQRYPVRRQFAEGFESCDRLGDLIGPVRQWTSFTLQSPRAPEIDDYNRLRRRILEGRSGFLDNRVEPSGQVVHTGQRSLRCCSVAPSWRMITAKASLSTCLLYFKKGDEFWFSGWYYAPAGQLPLTIMDLESTWLKEHPGMRIMIEDGCLALELKWGEKPKFRQPADQRKPFPTDRWCHVRLWLRLSNDTEGEMRLWQDGVELISARGQTLPLASTIYDDLEVGISAHSFGPGPATLYVDDIAVSDRPLP